MAVEVFTKAPVLSAEDQLDRIRRISSSHEYVELYKTLFGFDSFYSRNFNEFLDDNTVPNDFFKLAGLNAILFAQYGFNSMEGQIGRHTTKARNWKLPVFHRWHLLALACYGGSINDQVFPLKNQFVQQLPSDISDGMWAYHPLVSGGEVMVPDMTLEQAKDMAKVLRDQHFPICRPTIELNRQLRSLDFTGAQAEKMDSDTFNAQIYPQAREILGDILDPKILK